MIKQYTINLNAKSRGFHLITADITSSVPLDGATTGLLHLCLQHTSASLSLNENADPTVRQDCLNFFNKLVPEDKNFLHSMEGLDDMPAHLKSMLLGAELTLPITRGTLSLGIWQGIYLGEHRNHAQGRSIVATLMT